MGSITSSGKRSVVTVLDTVSDSFGLVQKGIRSTYHGMDALEATSADFAQNVREDIVITAAYRQRERLQNKAAELTQSAEQRHAQIFGSGFDKQDYYNRTLLELINALRVEGGKPELDTVPAEYNIPAAQPEQQPTSH